jgi:hypothetical protein
MAGEWDLVIAFLQKPWKITVMQIPVYSGIIKLQIPGILPGQGILLSGI